MASQHRKPRSAGTRVAGIRTPTLATAALTSVALLSQTADAAPQEDGKPSLEEVEKKVDNLYRQAESATEKYNFASEKTTKKRAAAPDTATFPQADTPQEHVDRNQPTNRLTDRQKGTVADYVTEQSATTKRQEATGSLATLADSPDALKTAKATVQKKLGDARELLSRLTAQENARLAAIEKQKQNEAARKAAELAQQQAAELARQQATELAQQQAADQAAAQAAAQQESGGDSSNAGSPSASTSASPSADSPYATKAAKAIAFARAQIGKPYVWGATGPDSYDCSGLTQAVWKAAGVTLPRTTHDQAKAGTKVSLTDARPGDLIFFYDDVSHAGVYIGNGMMIHAPKPGAYVREESVRYDGETIVPSVVRPA
ncbi:NlpC/P60 family protein [Streptomyces sp. NPDC006872]|uniref:C40 family peptidase n=1 Tax=Streptomyces sp. NPDC006872 TaxID=3155720 RepID=UPI0033C26157